MTEKTYSIDIEKILGEMTLEDKARMVSGKNFWFTEDYPELGVPAVQVSDGPHGLRKMEEDADHVENTGTIDAVCFPAACATAASFDTDLMEDMGHILGKECQAEKVSVLLGPAVNIKRSPLCGRNFEYISEDPYVAGKLSAAYIRGVQEEGVGTSIKHFAANNQEFERMYGSSEVDERTLREIYFPAFEIAVKEAAPRTVMCSYNRINGVYSSENPWLLNEVLRKEWGFKGAVMSDWGAVSDRIAGIAAGLDLEMPGSGGVNDKRIMEAVASGRLSQQALDEAVRNILSFVKAYAEDIRPGVFDRDEDHKKAVEIEKECIVLLKNRDQALPLDKEEKICFIGGFAATPRFQGGGSSHISTVRVEAAMDVAGEYGNISYSEGFSATEDKVDPDLQDRALEEAEKADKIVVFAGLPDSFESEGYDRDHMRLPLCQNQLIDRLTALGKPVIVVLHNGSPVELPWADQAAGILEAYLGGEGVGRAVMDILYGRANPCGKLAESFPVKLQDNPSYLNFPGTGHKVNYAEGLFVGYRYYDTKQMEVRFPFGYGLSYTDFRYGNLRVSREHFTAAEGVTVSVDVTNTGKMAGKEIVQLYVADKTGTAVRPVHELKGFTKLSLLPGETKTAVFTLDKRAFAWYSDRLKDWYAANGLYTIEVGSSSRDIKYKADVRIIGSKELPPVITPDVQFGDLLASPYTADFVREHFQERLNRFAMGGGESESPEMVEAVVRFMPVRAMRSFLQVSNEEIEAFCAGLQEHIDQQLEKQ